MRNAKVRTQPDRVRAIDTRRILPPAKTADPFYLSSEWRKLMDEIIAERGRICEDPHCDGRTHSPTMRVNGDHIVELRDGGAPLDKRNVMLRCGASHSRKTAQERAKRLSGVRANGAGHPEWLTPSLIPLVIVCGPPASGKSTYVQRLADPTDLVLDLDEIAASISKRSVHEALAAGWLDEALRKRNYLLSDIGKPQNRWPRAWLIVAEPTAQWRQWWADKLHPQQVVVMATPEQQCLARISAAADRVTTRSVISNAVMRWWNDYTPRDGDLVLTQT